MAKKIMILSASPNKHGNTASLIQWFSQGAKKKGAGIEIIDTANLKYKANGCTACMGCQKSDKYECVIDDEASPLISRIPKVDVLVFATPVYFCGPSAQLKLFMDRMFSLYKFKRNGDKEEITHNLQNTRMALIASSGGDISSGLKFVEDVFKTTAAFTNVKFDSLLVPSAGFSGDLKNNSEAREMAIAFGEKLG